MIDHSHLTHGCRPGRYREHDPRDRIYDVIKDLGSSVVSPVSKGLLSLFIKRNTYILIAFQMRHSSDAIRNIFKESPRKKFL